AVKVNAVAFEDFQDAGVGNATREPSAERQPDTRGVWRRVGTTANQRMDNRRRRTSSCHEAPRVRGQVQWNRCGEAQQLARQDRGADDSSSRTNGAAKRKARA